MHLLGDPADAATARSVSAHSARTQENDPPNADRLAALEERVRLLEERLQALEEDSPEVMQ